MYACNRKTKEMIFGIDRKTINQHLQVFDGNSKAMVYIEMFIENIILT